MAKKEPIPARNTMAVNGKALRMLTPSLKWTPASATSSPVLYSGPAYLSRCRSASLKLLPKEKRLPQK